MGFQLADAAAGASGLAARSTARRSCEKHQRVHDADANAPVFEQLADGETVFYANFGERFFRADGAYNRDYWGKAAAPAGVGIQPAAYEVLAEELQPWIDRFIR